VTGVRVLEHGTGREEVINADLVVSATGAWAEKVARLGGRDRGRWWR